MGSPDNLAVSTSHVDVTCFGGADGSITLTASGGTPPFSYQWDNGAGTDPSPQDLPANTYSVVITDANGCTIVASETINEPPIIAIQTEGTTNATCGEENGAIDITVSGGVGGYSYVWNNSGGTQVSTDEDPINLGAGSYFVTVTDGNGCTMEFSEDVTTPNMLLVSTMSDSTSCFGGTDGHVQIVVTGGVPPFSYTWNDSQYDGMDELFDVPGRDLCSDGDGCGWL